MHHQGFWILFYSIFSDFFKASMRKYIGVTYERIVSDRSPIICFFLLNTYLFVYSSKAHQWKVFWQWTSALIRAWQCNFPPISEIVTDRPTIRQIWGHSEVTLPSKQFLKCFWREVCATIPRMVLYGLVSSHGMFILYRVKY